jgi:hypothetical protein
MDQVSKKMSLYLFHQTYGANYNNLQKNNVNITVGTNVRLRLQIFYTNLYNYDRRTLLHFLLKLDFRFIGQTHVQ